MSLLQQLANLPRRVIKPKRKPGCPSPKHHIDGQIDLQLADVCICGADRTGPTAEAHKKGCPMSTNVVESTHEDEIRIREVESVPGPTIPELVERVSYTDITSDDLCAISVPRDLSPPNPKTKIRSATKRPRKRKERKRKC